MPGGCKSLAGIYGDSKPTLALMPIGVNGIDFMKKCKQTEADRRECIKRGAETVLCKERELET